MATQGSAPPVDPGDLGRRVRQRRAELGLSPVELARRAGMDPGYLAYLETTATGEVSYATLLRLAASLDTSVEALMGGGGTFPPGQSGPPPRPRLRNLTVDECWGHLGTHGVGRTVFVDQDGPAAVPVNYRRHGDELLLRTGLGSRLAVAAASGSVSMEADHIDDALHQGWSVLIRGSVRVVSDPEELAGLADSDVESWAGEDRPVHVMIRAERITGRAIAGQG
ncbi:MAG: helix-turn-helix domain-containing protein [Actinomycetes bacterium]